MLPDNSQVLANSSIELEDRRNCNVDASFMWIFFAWRPGGDPKE
jgi:hypothetical protein